VVDTPKPLASAFAQPSNFSIHEVPQAKPAVAGAVHALAVPVPLPANLGPLAAFTGTFAGRV
jgi:hypothetical protein